MLSFVKLCNQNKKFSRLTGVKLEEFLEIVKKVRPLWEKFQKSKKVNKHKLFVNYWNIIFMKIK